MDLEHERRLTAVESRSKSNEYRLSEVEKRQDDLDKLVSTVETLAVREKNVEDDVKEMKTDVKILVNKPAKRWDSLTEKVILTIVAAVLGFILAKMGF